MVWATYFVLSISCIFLAGLCEEDTRITDFMLDNGLLERLVVIIHYETDKNLLVCDFST